MPGKYQRATKLFLYSLLKAPFFGGGLDEGETPTRSIKTEVMIRGDSVGWLSCGTDCIRPILFQIHWPVSDINSKCWVLSFKVLNSTKPQSPRRWTARNLHTLSAFWGTMWWEPSYHLFPGKKTKQNDEERTRNKNIYLKWWKVHRRADWRCC